MEKKFLAYFWFYFANLDLFDTQMTLKAKVKFRHIQDLPIQDLLIMHLMAKFGKPRLNPSKVIVRTNAFSADLDHFDTKMTLKV